MMIYDQSSFLHRLSFLWSSEESEEELQRRIPKNKTGYNVEEKNLSVIGRNGRQNMVWLWDMTKKI